MLARKSSRPAIKTATCAALIAATLSTPAATEVVNSIERYCATSWQRAGIPLDDWNDCTQETMLELLSRLSSQRLSQAIEHPRSEEHRELMRSVWCVAQRWRRSSQRRPVSLDMLDECVDATASAPEHVQEAAISDALEKLSPMQKRILQLWADGSRVADISAELDLPAARVSDLKYKAIRNLKKQLSRPSGERTT